MCIRDSPNPHTQATVKQAKPDGTVEKTLDRSTLWEMHTPQVYRTPVALVYINAIITPYST